MALAPEISDQQPRQCFDKLRLNIRDGGHGSVAHPLEGSLVPVALGLGEDALSARCNEGRDEPPRARKLAHTVG
jgi:hypothetical protein